MPYSGDHAVLWSEIARLIGQDRSQTKRIGLGLAGLMVVL